MITPYDVISVFLSIFGIIVPRILKDKIQRYSGVIILTFAFAVSLLGGWLATYSGGLFGNIFSRIFILITLSHLLITYTQLEIYRRLELSRRMEERERLTPKQKKFIRTLYSIWEEEQDEEETAVQTTQEQATDEAVAQDTAEAGEEGP